MNETIYYTYEAMFLRRIYTDKWDNIIIIK